MHIAASLLRGLLKRYAESKLQQSNVRGIISCFSPVIATRRGERAIAHHGVCTLKGKKSRRWCALTVASCLHAVHTKSGVLLLDLSRLDRRQRLDRTEAGIFGQSHGHGVQCISKGPHGILFEARTLQMYVSNLPQHPDLKIKCTLTAASSTAREQAISAAPPPYTTRLSRTKLRTTHSASCNERLASSMICKELTSDQYVVDLPWPLHFFKVI